MTASGPRIQQKFLVAGFLLPCLLSFFIFLTNLKVEGSLEWIILILWPTFPFVMSAEADPTTAGFLIAFLISAAANVLVYGLAGSIIAFLHRRFLYRPS